MRWPSKKRVVEECVSLDANALTRAGVFRVSPGTPCTLTWRDAAGQEMFRAVLFVTGSSKPRLIQIRQPLPGSQSAVLHSVPLAQESCFGRARRAVFQCPGRSGRDACGKPVRKLYLIDGAWICRACANLTYFARQQHDRRRDFLMHNPLALAFALRSGDPKQQLLAVGAYAQALTRLNRLQR